ncbi:class I SAM-dependent methyltransferase, partial [Candidatus Latescibacterota bacterium]
LYESFGILDYNSYYFESRESAGEIVSLIQKHIDPNGIKICEWGCGPVRLLRHFDYHLKDYNVELFGTDYNKKTIKWCKRNFPDITFIDNQLHPPLDFPDNYLDAIYCVSVFTHLSRELQIEWLNECLRVIKPDGIFLMTVHGDSCSKKLLKYEQDDYKSGGYVMRGKVKEGKRNFVSYNNPSYIRNVLLKDADILEFIPGGRNNQDMWIIKK